MDNIQAFVPQFRDAQPFSFQNDAVAERQNLYIQFSEQPLLPADDEVMIDIVR